MAVAWIDSVLRDFFHGLAKPDPDWNHPIGAGNKDYHAIQERRPGGDINQRSVSGGIFPRYPLPFKLCAGNGGNGEWQTDLVAPEGRSGTFVSIEIHRLWHVGSVDETRARKPRPGAVAGGRKIPARTEGWPANGGGHVFHPRTSLKRGSAKSDSARQGRHEPRSVRSGA